MQTASHPRLQEVSRCKRQAKGKDQSPSLQPPSVRGPEASHSPAEEEREPQPITGVRRGGGGGRGKAGRLKGGKSQNKSKSPATGQPHTGGDAVDVDSHVRDIGGNDCVPPPQLHGFDDLA